MRLQTRGVNQVDPGEAETAVCEIDGVFPDFFYSTTNLATRVRLGGRWVPVENPEMDCGLIVDDSVDPVRVYTLPMADVKAGMKVVCGASGLRVEAPVLTKAEGSFGFMESDVSTEKPQAVLVRQVADGMRRPRPTARRCCGSAAPASSTPARLRPWSRWSTPATSTCCSPATRWPPTTSSPPCSGRRWESTSRRAVGVEHGHEHHIRALNTIRKAGSIQAAVDSGVLTGGIMHALVTGGKEYVLVGSVRDDGPLPDVYTDVIEGQRAMRASSPTSASA